MFFMKKPSASHEPINEVGIGFDVKPIMIVGFLMIVGVGEGVDAEVPSCRVAGP